MLIHPWDAALDPAEWQGWLASTDRFGMLAVNNLDPAKAPLVLPPTSPSPATSCSSTWPGRTRSGRTWRRPPRCGWRWSATTPTSRPTGGPRQAGPTRTACRPATTPPCSSCAHLRWSTTQPARRKSSPPSSPTSSPKAATRPWPSAQHPTDGCCPASAASGSPVLRVDAKFKYDDHNPVEHRKRVIGRLERRDHGLDAGAATQQRRRLAAIGDWQTHRHST